MGNASDLLFFPRVPSQQVTQAIDSFLATDKPLFSTSPKTVMFAGDSIVIGFSNGDQGGSPGFRGEFYRLARLTGDDVHLVGPYLDVMGENTLATPNRYVPVEPRHAGFSGDTIQALNTRIAAQIATAGAIDVLFVMIGTNNCSSDSSVTMIGRMTTLHATLRTACGTATKIVYQSIPLVLVANQAVRNAFNAALPAWVAGLSDPNASFLDTCGDFTQAEQGQSPPGTLDGHPNDRGYSIGGLRQYLCLRSLFSAIPNGVRAPRERRRRIEQYAVALAANLDACSANNAAVAPGTGSFWFAVDVVPTVLPGNGVLNSIGGYAGTYNTDGFTVAVVGNGTAYSDLNIYCTPQGSAATICRNVFQVGRRTRVVVSGHAADGLLAVWVNGVLANVVAAPAWTMAAAKRLNLGATSGLVTFRGQYDNWAFGQGATVPAFDAMRAFVEADYFEGDAPPGKVALYKMGESTGNSLTEASLGTAAARGSWDVNPVNGAAVFTSGGGTTAWTFPVRDYAWDPTGVQQLDPATATPALNPLYGEKLYVDPADNLLYVRRTDGTVIGIG